MTTTPQRCNRSDPHQSHLWNPSPIPITAPPTPEGWVAVPLAALASCPGWDGPTPERERPEPEFDWAPETLHLTHAAAMVVRAHAGEFTTYAAMVDLWSELCGMPEPEALTWAYQIATAVPAVEAVLPPF